MAEVARATTARGDVVLSRSAIGALELRVNGMLVMSGAETSTEELLATLVLDELGALTAPGNETPHRRLTIVVAGLGLGVTAAGLLKCPLVDDILIAEIEPDLVAWHLDGTISPPDDSCPGGVLADPRVRVEARDVRQVVAGLPAGCADAVVLDIDNGPGALVYEANSAVYEEPFLKRCSAALRPRGVVAVWSADPSPSLLAAMRAAFERVGERAVPVTLGRRLTTYHLFFGQRLP